MELYAILTPVCTVVSFLVTLLLGRLEKKLDYFR